MREPLLPLVEKYFETDHIAAAHSLETLPEAEAVAVLKVLAPQISANAFLHLRPEYAAALLQAVPQDLFEEILEHLEPHHGAAIFAVLPEDIRGKMLDWLSPRIKDEIRELLTFPVDSAGRIMNKGFIALWDDLKVKDAVSRIRQLSHLKETPFYVYVVDKENHLVGVVNMRDILLADESQDLAQVMRRNVFSINAFTDREEVAEMLSNRKYLAAPVVNAENRLIGVIDTERLIHGVQEEATEDMQKMFGAGGDERVFSPIAFALKKRLPWLHVNLATAFLAAWVVSLFESVIARITVLAVFLPVVAGQGGNAGAQSLAVVMRGLVMREIPHQKAWQLIIRETMIGTVNGVIIGLVTALGTWLWLGKPMLGFVVGLAMIVNLVIAGFSGSAIPIFMKALKLDPAQCSNIILTTVTDVMGFLAFLGFAVIFQNWLI